MDAVGIIAEFDPFHNGHKYLFDTVHVELPSHALVCVMSGNFVQRGQPAVCSKWTRAEMAVRCGADLVLEMPFVYACNSAPEFAKGGVKVLKAAGCGRIAFGSESGDEDMLRRTACISAEESDVFRNGLKDLMDSGRSYAEAYTGALRLLDPGIGFLKDSPNDLLAVEYLKQNMLQNAGMKSLCVKRKGSAHDSLDGLESGYASATALREAIKNGNMNSVIVNLPHEIAEMALSVRYFDNAAKSRLFDLLRHNIVMLGAEGLSGVYGMSEGLENAIVKSSLLSRNTNDLIMGAKSRRYTFARLSRLMMYILTGLSDAVFREIDSGPLPYIKPLAMNSRGAEVLRGIKEKGGIDIVSNVNKYEPSSRNAELMLSHELLASDVYSEIMGLSLHEGSDHTRSPIYIR